MLLPLSWSAGLFQVKPDVEHPHAWEVSYASYRWRPEEDGPLSGNTMENDSAPDRKWQWPVMGSA
jgi:hypothetical protein